MAMGKAGAILRFLLWVFIVLFALAVFLLPHLDLKGVRQRIAGEASSKLNGKVLITRASLALFPWPHITLKEVQIESPQWGELASEEIGIYPRLTPLFKKQVVLKRLRLERPVINVTFVEGARGKGKEAVSYLEQSIIQAIPALDINGGMVNIRLAVRTLYKRHRLLCRLIVCGFIETPFWVVCAGLEGPIRRAAYQQPCRATQ